MASKTAFDAENLDFDEAQMAAVRATTRRFRSGEYLTSEEAIAAYLDEARAIGDPDFLVQAEQVAAEARALLGL